MSLNAVDCRRTYTGCSLVTAYNGNVIMEKLLTADDLAALLNIQKRSVYVARYTRGNLPPAIKVGGLLRFRPSDVETWLANQPASARNIARAEALEKKRSAPRTETE
ncbi:helix-turn-helix transcriptional regulator [Paraburkholderia phenazinium]|uniref:helix-turn-helix transcriptional regulator n=2 Tax=Paraburkholderia phenazinium TaxID=60549 RepID=UPI003CC5756A